MKGRKKELIEQERRNGEVAERVELDRCQLDRVDDQLEFDSNSNWWRDEQVPTVAGTQVADGNGGKWLRSSPNGD